MVWMYARSWVCNSQPCREGSGLEKAELLSRANPCNHGPPPTGHCRFIYKISGCISTAPDTTPSEKKRKKRDELEKRGPAWQFGIVAGQKAMVNMLSLGYAGLTER